MFTSQHPTGHDEGAVPSPHEPFDPAISGPDRPHFSQVLTILSATVLLGCILFFGWLQLKVPRLDRVSSPERALALTVSRMMDLEEAIAHAPEWERLLYEMTGGGGNELEQAISWYEELAAYSGDPLVQVHLAILEAEDGRLDRVQKSIARWESRKDPLPTFARLIRAGYLESKPDPASELTLKAELEKALQDGWFYDRLAMSLATRTGDRAALSTIEHALAERGVPLLWRTRVLLALDLTVILVGTVALLALSARWRRDWSALKVGEAPIPPQWRGREGTVVLIRGGAIGGALMLGFLFMGTENPLIRVLAIPAVNLPAILLARRHLLNPLGSGLRQGLGLWPSPGAWQGLGLAVPALMAAGLIGEWGMGLVAESVSLPNHWTEWFDGDLVWGPLPVVTTSLLEYVIFAPVFEEMTFRGLLFATLRRKFGWSASAGMSAAIFAIAHGYGVLGFANVFWSGVLWAWAYEKTGSLLPGILAHSLNNLIVSLTVIWLLRF
ncbi:MAG: CPBP family intramembrane metalloprotease [Nitrospirae bacterium]|nr:CPBP family intramembrane metalloprotease [Nitrospirota bacterium]